MVAETEHDEVDTVEAETVEESGQSTAVAHFEERRAIAPAAPTGMTPMQMLEVAVSNGRDLSVIDKLMDLQERWERNQGKKAFDNAVADAKAKIPPIIKNREVDFTNKSGQRTHYRHEDMAGVARVVDPILSEFGLSYRYRTEIREGIIWVTCILSHRDGYSEETSLPAARDESGNKNSIQAMGSTVTYLQRYTLKAALGLASAHDDDAQAAEARAEDLEPISEDRVKHIRAELEALGADEAAFCHHIKVPNLVEMPASRFGDACEALDAKRRQNERKKAAEAKAAAAEPEFPGDRE